jgi:hypothetical protein
MREEECIENHGGKARKKKNLDVGGRIILKWILGK